MRTANRYDFSVNYKFNLEQRVICLVGVGNDDIKNQHGKIVSRCQSISNIVYCVLFDNDIKGHRGSYWPDSLDREESNNHFNVLEDDLISEKNYSEKELNNL